jgi:arylsulfatase
VRYNGFALKNGAIGKAFASVRDLAPTFLELAGASNPGADYKGRKVHPITGTSLVSYLAGKAAVPHGKDYVSGEELFGNRSIRQGDWKLLWTQPPVGTGRWELFDLSRDPGETSDLATKNPAKVADLVVLWDAYVRQNNVVLPEGANVYLDRPLSIDN